MNIKVLQRLRAVESVLATKGSPDLVMISYEADKGKYRIYETFNRKDARGEAMRGGTGKESFVDDPKKYIFPEGCRAKVFYDLMQEEHETLFAFSCEELRKGAGLAPGVPFSIGYVEAVEGAGKPQGILEVVPYERG